MIRQPDTQQDPQPDVQANPQPAVHQTVRQAVRRRRTSSRVRTAAAELATGHVFRRAVASLALLGLLAALHIAGISIQLPKISFAWPWQKISSGSTTNTDLGPWVLQKIEGISRPALGEANFTFLFTHRVSRSIGPWPCWYASTFYAVGHASATVELNPGPAWWTPAAGHYQLRTFSRPGLGKPGHVAVTMVLRCRSSPSRPTTSLSTIFRPGRQASSTAGRTRGWAAACCCGPSSRRQCCIPWPSRLPLPSPGTPPR